MFSLQVSIYVVWPSSLFALVLCNKFHMVIVEAVHIVEICTFITYDFEVDKSRSCLY